VGEHFVRVTNPAPTLRSGWVEDGDGAMVLGIYQAGMDGGNATFETEAPSWEAFKAKWRDDLRLVGVDDGGAVLGWSAAHLSRKPGQFGADGRCGFRVVVSVTGWVAISVGGVRW
jgi:L-amino acid N-acyltransferase YncA